MTQTDVPEWLPKRWRTKIAAGPSGCWLWTAAKNREGYGYGKADGTYVRVHRYAYERTKGHIPEGLQIDHVCNVRNCLNPAHLRLATPRENTLRSTVAIAAINSRKTHCPRGHPYDVITSIRRDCSICRAAKQARYMKRKEAA